MRSFLWRPCQFVSLRPTCPPFRPLLNNPKTSSSVTCWTLCFTGLESAPLPNCPVMPRLHKTRCMKVVSPSTQYLAQSGCACQDAMGQNITIGLSTTPRVLLARFSVQFSHPFILLYPRKSNELMVLTDNPRRNSTSRLLIPLIGDTLVLDKSFSIRHMEDSPSMCTTHREIASSLQRTWFSKSFSESRRFSHPEARCLPGIDHISHRVDFPVS